LKLANLKEIIDLPQTSGFLFLMSSTRFLATPMGFITMAWFGSKTYFFSCETQKHCTHARVLLVGQTYKPLGFTFEELLQGPIYLGLNFSIMLNFLTPLIGEVFKSTLSPVWNWRGHLLLSL